MITLHSFPMPPSSNHVYATIQRDAKSWRTKSAELREFERDALNWALAGGPGLHRARDLAKQARNGKNLVLDVHAKFYFKRERILCKNGKPKRLDTSNRIKALHDALATILEVDDCFFWSLSADKAAILGNAPESVLITIKLREIY